MTSFRKLSSALCVAAVASGVLALNTTRISAESVKLTGCLIKSEGNGGFLLINPPMEPGASSADRRTVAPGSMGTTAMFANVFYWIERDSDLTPHIGHRVEIEGDTKGDVKKGEMKIERKDSWTEIEVKSNGKEMKARVPNASLLPGHDDDKKIDLLVRRLDADKVRMLDAVCR